ncbi:HAD-IB family phosphatase [Thermosphaera chiliense]|uniref:phosphoserine phosphatase n=1 Tax=Thermosphaera chiliense TaxID=3402707 RepID=A0A7M1URP4_9CREN|nr:HAD-IB family phosphatase [Thermosphaera aggregans]QOR94945.1 HAD-IB family phosphatase [Thermosphaera aggregans]
MKPLVVFDCDGVLTENNSSWRVLHEFFGSRDNSYFAELYEKGLISYLDWMKIDISLMIHSFGSPIKKHHVEEAFSKIKPKKSAARVVGELLRNNYPVAVVSSGIGILVSRICRELGVSDCLFNDVLFVNDELVPGGVARVPLKEKWLVIKKLAESKGYRMESVAYVGDSKWDIPVFKQVGISIAVKPCGIACEHAKYVVEDLEEVLSLLIR